MVFGEGVMNMTEIKFISPERLVCVLRDLVEYITSGKHYERKNSLDIKRINVYIIDKTQ